MTQTTDSPSTDNSYDLVVIGAGPGGYVAAIRAAQLGMKVACVDKGWWGGVCLNVGCIPSKAMLDSSNRFYEAKTKLAGHGINIKDVSLDLGKMIGRKEQVVKGLTNGVLSLFKKNKIEAVHGAAKLTSADTIEVALADGKGNRTLKAKKVLIATGSVPTELPGLPFDGKFVVTSTEALAFTELPKKLIVVGGGYIGVEMGSVWARLGSEVTVIEFTDRILPLMDQELGGMLQRALAKQGLKFVFGAAAQKAEVKGKEVTVTYKVGDKTETATADKVLVCTGRRPLTAGLGLDAIGVALDRGFVKIDDHFQTNVPGVYAIGDVVGGLMLAHKAEEEGIAAVELMAGKAGHVNYKTVPGIVYTHPELAQVGLTEAEAKKASMEVKVGKFPMAGNGRAKAMDDAEGWVKIVADAKTDRVLGVQILAGHASDMLAECVVAMEMAASSEDIARSFHAHPTMSEAVKEAALAVEKRAIHF